MLHGRGSGFTQAFFFTLEDQHIVMLGSSLTAAEAARGFLGGDGFHAVKFPSIPGFTVDHVAEIRDGLFGFLFCLDAQNHWCGHRQMDRLLQPDPASQQPGWDNPGALLPWSFVKGSLMREKTS